MAFSTSSGLILMLCAGVVFGSVCSPQNRTENLAGCLSSIVTTMTNSDLFWFGSDYSTNCPNGPASGFSCSNPSPNVVHSIAARVLPSSYDTALLTEYVHVEFTSEPGQYTGCGNTFTETETTMINLDPASSQIVHPWFVRHTPEMTWDSTPGEYYSLYVYDVGYYITHGIYINIQGNAIPTSGENVIDEYHGPLITTNLHNPYTFMLFKQDGYLEPAAAKAWYNSTHTPNTMASSSHIPGFMTQLNMTGPIGINWLVATGDEYAANSMRMRNIMSMCPVYIGRAMDLKPRPFLPNPASLTVQMHMDFHVTELSYKTCCKDYEEEKRTLTLNPIGNPILNTSSTRTGLVQNVTFEKLGFSAMSKMFTGERYTLIALDPDVPSATVGTEALPLLHQMKINIMDGNFTTGEDVIAWSGPTPPNDEPHYYYFLLYKHAQSVNQSLMTSYAGDCGDRLAGRCLYDIKNAVSDNNFTLVGANWFRSVRDPYVIYRNIQNNPNNTQAQCAGQPGYTVDCVTSGVPIGRVSTLIMFALSAFWVKLYIA